MILVGAFKRIARSIRAYRFALAAFLLPFTVRAIPEIIAGPYPIGWDTIAFYVPTTLDMAAGKVGVWGILGSAPLMYAITVPIYILTGISPVLLYKILGPVLFGSLSLAVFRFCKQRLGFTVKTSFLAIVFLSFYFITLRLAWDAYHIELGLTTLLLGMTFSTDNELNSRKSILKTIFFVLSILSSQVVGVLAVGILTFELLRTRANGLKMVIPYLGSVAVFGLIIYGTLHPTYGPGISTLGENAAPLNLGYNTLFLVYALGPIIPLAVMGVARIKGFPFRGWIAICAIGIILSAFPGQVFQDIGYRWILILSIPLIVAAAQGYQNLAQVPGLARGSWLRQIRLGVPLLLILTAGVYTTIETPTVPYFNLFLGYVPSSLLQSSVPLSDSANIVDALHWIANSLPADSALITHEAFYGWAKLYLPPNSAIINSLLSSPTMDLGQATQYQHVYTIWWTPGTGWFAPTFPTGARMTSSFGDIGVYKYR